jgi:NAD+ diphosphatase
MAEYIEGEINKSSEVEWVDWSYIKDALSEMDEDEIGKRIVRKVLREIKCEDSYIKVNTDCENKK